VVFHENLIVVHNLLKFLRGRVAVAGNGVFGGGGGSLTTPVGCGFHRI
jgi:hypothetical protein